MLKFFLKRCFVIARQNDTSSILHPGIWFDWVGGSTIGSHLFLFNSQVVDDQAHGGKYGEETRQDGTAKGPGQKVGVGIGQPLTICVGFDSKYGRRYRDEKRS